MAATPGELLLILQLQKLAGGQAAGSFGPAQAYAMLVGFVKLRDRVDQLVASVADFGGIDAAPRLAALEELLAELQNVVAHDTDADTALEQWKAGIEGRLADLETAAHPPPAA